MLNCFETVPPPIRPSHRPGAILSKDTVFRHPLLAMVRCPRCGFDSVHQDAFLAAEGGDEYRAQWGGRGSLHGIRFSAECGSRFELCFGLHKGQTFAFVRLITPCDVVEAPHADS